MRAKGLWFTAATAVTAAAVALGATSAYGATSGDSPAGYWYGTDSFAMTGQGSAPYHEPVTGGAYGGYIGMIGDWAKSAGCKKYGLAWSSANAAQANTDLTKYGEGIGTGTYWFMGGPGVDPHYNGTTAEAAAWGAHQAAQALAAVHANLATVKYPVIFMDVEIPGSTLFDPALDNGWNNVYTSACSGKIRTSFIAPGIDRADFNGFASYVVAHSTRKVGVYSSPAVWADIFGTGSASRLSNTYEWTYANDTSSLSHHPAGWCLHGTSTCARFFGGISSSSVYALMWQWSGGGGTFNGHGDFDQINATHIK
jgi:hypothetical protein